MPNIVEILVVFLVVIFLTVMNASWWTIFEKAGQPGWAALVPPYNLVVIHRITGKPLWWLIFFLFPCFIILSPIFWRMLMRELSVRFGKGFIYRVGLVMAPVLFLPLLAYGGATYEPPPPK